MFGVPETDSRSLAEQIQAEPARFRLIDVRSPGEWAQGIIAGAELMPLHVVPLEIDQPQDDRLMVFYCRSGARSAQACAFLMSRGQQNVTNLRGGILDWARQGLPLVAPS